MAKETPKGTTAVTVYTPHRAGLPHLGNYASSVWRRLDFARELSDTNMRAANTNTFFGQLWLVLNPLLLAGIYYFLIIVITKNYSADFAQIAGGLFLFFYITGIVQSCATAVTTAGSLILNMNFPKYLLIISNAYLAFRRFLPTLLVYAVIHLLFRKPITVQLLWIPLILLVATLIAVGLGSIVATWQVYFRDTAQFLPYFIRIWLYASPVLYSAETFMTGPIGKKLGHWANINPAFSVLGLWSDVIHGHMPPWHYFALAAAWALVLFIPGTLYFVSREREFAVRL